MITEKDHFHTETKILPVDDHNGDFHVNNFPIKKETTQRSIRESLNGLAILQFKQLSANETALQKDLCRLSPASHFKYQSQ